MDACYDLGTRIAVAWEGGVPPVGALIWFAAALIAGLLRRPRPNAEGPPPFELVIRVNPACQEDAEQV